MQSAVELSSQADLEQLSCEINELLMAILSINHFPAQADLLDGGYVDSLSLIQILVSLEKRFAIHIPLDELQIEDMRSIASIARLVHDRRKS